MSESNLGAGSGMGGAPRPPARNMADIARMFLDGARPTSESGAPRRLGPKERRENGPVTAPEAAVERSPVVETKLADIAELPRVMLALIGPGVMGSDFAGRLASAGTKLAEDFGGMIGLISLREDTFAIDVVGNPGAVALPEINAGAGAAIADVQVARALFTLRHAIGHWVIAAPEADSVDFPRLGAAIPDWVLITPTGNDQVVGAYQELKRAMAVSMPAHDPQAIMMAGDAANAAVIHTRLQRAAKQFLGKDLVLAGIAGLFGAPSTRVMEVKVGADERGAVYAAVLDELCGTLEEGEEETVVVEDEFEDEVVEAPAKAAAPFGMPVPEEREGMGESQHSIDIDGPLDAATSAAVEAALQADHSAVAASALFDQLTHVLDPEERDALSADLFESTVLKPVMEKREAEVEMAPVVEKAAVVVPVAAPERSGALPALKAVDCAGTDETDRGGQWRAVERSVRELVPSSVVLDARPPMSWAGESTLAIDAAGGLHVWTLYKDGVSWFALREWATEHRSLLGLTRRDLVMKEEAGVTVHVVLPLEGAGDIGALMRAGPTNLFLYRMRVVELGGRRGVLVVPLA